MTAAVMTLDSLLDDIEVYADRHDADFLAQRARFVMLAENRISEEARGLGLQKAVTSTLRLGYADFEKPARWRETISFNIGVGASYTERKFLRLRTYEYCRTYWPEPATQGEPKYYADWDFNHWLIAPTPSYAYPFELLYYERPLPLSTTNQTNWTTENAPQLILYACLLEAMPWLKNDGRIQTFQTMYDRALAQLAGDETSRVADRTAVKTEKK